MRLDLIRQFDILPPDKTNEFITIVGAGAIGSFTALALAKMGFSKIIVYDHDKVTIENMNCQFFRHGDIGEPKVIALKNLIKDFTRTEIVAINGKFDGKDMIKGILISCVDSMAARKLIWESAKDSLTCKAFIDSRMGAEEAALYTMFPKVDRDIEAYESSLYTDDDATPERCTAKSTMYTVLAIASQVCNSVKQLVTNNEYPRTILWSISGNDFVVNTNKEERCSFH